jgi:hypothetical protein
LTELVTVDQKEASSNKWAILSALERMANGPDFSSCPADHASPALKEYYTLTREESAALAIGDIRHIQSWVGKLDKRLSAWLFYRLSEK